MLSNDQNFKSSKPGVLLVNTGTPDAPTKPAVEQYLRKFLLDRRIVNLPPLLWRPILEGIVLKSRPNKTVEIYKSIWTDAGSPYTLASLNLEKLVAERINNVGDTLDCDRCVCEHKSVPTHLPKHIPTPMPMHVPAPTPERIPVRMAHRYGNPSIAARLKDFQALDISRLIVLPLYPQQALAVTHSIYDELAQQLRKLNYFPDISFIWDYHTQDTWSDAIAALIAPHIAAEQNWHLLFSFHSIPLKDLRHGDRYKDQVEQSTRVLAQKLGLAADKFTRAYQSRFNDAQRWLGPFLSNELERLLDNTSDNILIICPGFAVDCTETLYDIQIAAATRLEQKHPDAKSRIKYIGCLNDLPAHVEVIAQIILNTLLREH